MVVVVVLHGHAHGEHHDLLPERFLGELVGLHGGIYVRGRRASHQMAPKFCEDLERVGEPAILVTETRWG
jgi:hypothetical protein